MIAGLYWKYLSWMMYPEGTHLLIPWFERPIIYDVRAKPGLINSTSGSKDLQMETLKSVSAQYNESQLLTMREDYRGKQPRVASGESCGGMSGANSMSRTRPSASQSGSRMEKGILDSCIQHEPELSKWDALEVFLLP
ncbi:hypothetical protein BSKO_04550 [Bryopsis sp. KO-2023]|nr:hypothetical protein BSKO_04550 [Bryopsis sp. KO-2023]